jgi:hypothetical protein
MIPLLRTEATKPSIGFYTREGVLFGFYTREGVYLGFYTREGV